MKLKSLKSKAVFYLALIMVSLIGIYSAFAYYGLASSINFRRESAVKSDESLIEAHINGEVASLESAKILFLGNFNAKMAFKNGDRALLLKETQNDFEALTKNTGITNVNFISPDGVMFLRLSQPGLYGDTVKRRVLKRAMAGEKDSLEIEEGTTTIALRSVSPVNLNGTLLGYIETAESLSSIIRELEPKTTSALAVLAPKKNVNQDSWSLVSGELGSYVNWNNTDNYVVMGAGTREDVSYCLTSGLNGQDKYFYRMVDVLGKKYGCSAIKIKTPYASDFLLVTLSDTTQIATLQSQTLTFLIIGSIILLIVYGGWAYFLLYNINIKPINILNEQVSLAFLRGIRDTEISSKSDDEIGELAKTIDLARTEIVNYENNLEKMVKESSAAYKEQAKTATEQNKDLEDFKSAVVNILEDVEVERQKSEQSAKELEKFKLAVEDASDHIVITDRDGFILYANKAVGVITGFEPDKIVGQKAGSHELWGGQMPLDFYQTMWHKIKVDKSVFRGEIKNRRKDGSLYQASVNISPILNSKNEVVFFVGIERDITREKMIDQAKTEFVSLASHQLRTPLSAINWYAEMLINGDAGKINDEQKQYLEEIYKGNQRMVDLVNSLLNVSRLELGTFEIKPESAALCPIVKDVLEEMQHLIEIKKLKVDTECKVGKNIPKVDKKLFRIIIQNLISNAVKYTPSGGSIKVVIDYNKDNPKSTYVLTVSDTGYGIPKSQQDKIFTKLFRADNVRAMDTEGTGLGLYIIKSIMDESGGKISFVSREKKGSTFKIELPKSGMKQKKGEKSLE